MTDIVSISTPDVELFSAPNSVRIHVKASFLDAEPEETLNWRKSLVDTDELNGRHPVVYIMADCSESIREWELALIGSMP